jgi:hypothetical protein
LQERTDTEGAEGRRLTRERSLVRTQPRPPGNVRYAVRGRGHGDAPRLASGNAGLDRRPRLRDATESDFRNCYDPWGRHKARTRPGVGDHEYLTPSAVPYFNYFGAAAGDPAKGYYSYDLGSWHVVVTNATCAEIGGCGTGSTEEQWLRQDLAANASACTLAVIHKPRFSSGSIHGNQAAMQPFWQALYDDGAELVLSGDDHVYERFGPQTPTGAADAARGIRQFVVGTGGRSHYSFGTIQPNSEARNSDTFGVLKLSLRSGAYDWQFVPEPGKTFTDAGTGSCH